MMKGSMLWEDLFIFHIALFSMTEKEIITWIIDNNYFHRWLLPMNGLQYWTLYYGHHVGNSPKFTPLDNILNRKILHSLSFIVS